MSDTKIPLAGVIGAPVAHSRSPKLHGYWLATHGVAGHYVPLHVDSPDFVSVLRMLPKMGFVGANVTIPHKEAALAAADVVTDRASLIGSANTLSFGSDGRVIADNTDGYGFIENLRQNAPHWTADAGAAVVFGAGGAARAVIVALLDAGVPEIRLANRTSARAETLREAFGSRVRVVKWLDAPTELADAATIVNTTSLGMVGQAPFNVPMDNLNRGSLVTDLVYTPLETEFLTHAKAAGCATVDGLGMLLHQAVPGFERWFGIRPEVTEDVRMAALA